MTEHSETRKGQGLAGQRFDLAESNLDANDLSKAVSQLRLIRANLLKQYSSDGEEPWVIAYSGGKDSTLVLHLVYEMLLGLKPSQRKRKVHVVSNDTLVESPLLIDHLKKNIGLIRDHAAKTGLPVDAKLTKPAVNQTFWVNLIGKGYMPPTRNFRWCTDKMKIAPTDRYLRNLCRKTGGAILLLGTRKLESQARRRNIEKRTVDDDGMNAHDSINNCRVYAPIVELSDDQVWMTLLQAQSHWGNSHREMITIYRNARGGECPTVLSKEDAPSCGSTSPRFGCWTCTVVQKDRSLEGLVDAGYEMFEALVDFRNWLAEIREDDSKRMPRRRNGVSRRREDGSYVMGPFTVEVRQQIMEKLLELQAEVKRELVTDEEVICIKEEWEKDRVDADLTDSFRARLRRKSKVQFAGA